MRFIDLTGKNFGRLTVLERVSDGKGKDARWQCQCECGNFIIAQSNNLKSGNTKSCGCIQKMLLQERNFKHGMAYTPEFNTWNEMKARCNNPKHKKYKNYGGRGIKIYPKWIKSFQTFFDYVGPKPTSEHSIERIDNDKGYFPGNVKWALPVEQANNTRSNHPITIGKSTLNLCQWAKKVGINYQIISYRIRKLGWSPEKAVFQPVRHWRKR